MNRSKQDAIKDIKKIAGVAEITPGTQEAILLKLDKGRMNSDGWYIKILETGEEAWAFNSFDWGEGYIPNGDPHQNVVIFSNEKVLVTREVDQEKWRILKGLSDLDSDIEVGERILKVGNSEIRITSERIDINTPEVYVNGEKL